MGRLKAKNKSGKKTVTRQSRIDICKSAIQESSAKSNKKVYGREKKEDAIRLYRALLLDEHLHTAKGVDVVSAVAHVLGLGAKTVRRWVAETVKTGGPK